MLIEWSQTAEDDLIVALTWYIEQENAALGQKIADRIFAATDRLAVFPHSGRPGLLTGTRELVLPDLPYFIVYRVNARGEIMRVLHTSRLWTGERLAS